MRNDCWIKSRVSGRVRDTMSIQPFHVVIPARLESTRLPRKALLPIAGKPMIQHVWERCCDSRATSVMVATDSQEIESVARSFGAKVAMTRSDHQSGTDRIAEVARAQGWTTERIVNVQADEPLMPPSASDQVAGCLDEMPEADMATLATPVESDEAFVSPDCVKVVVDNNGFALLFSRAPIPHPRRPGRMEALRHLGIYAYRADRLQALVEQPPCQLEQTESLEQLRALYIGQSIRVALANEVPPPGVDTQEDLDAIEALLGSQS